MKCAEYGIVDCKFPSSIPRARLAFSPTSLRRHGAAGSAGEFRAPYFLGK